MARKVLVVVDVQNDFAKGGALAYGYPAESNTEAIIAKVKETLANGDFVIATRDAHHENYLNTLEGKMLPVAHCIDGTKGAELCGELNVFAEKGEIAIAYKPTFGSFLVGDFIHETNRKYGPIDEIEVCGYCTSICVASNCSILRAQFPNMKITLLQDLCGDIDEESHKAALKVLRNQQIEIK